MACPACSTALAPHDKTAHGTNGKKLQERGREVRPVRQHVLESVRCMRANERRVQHMQVHNRSCVKAARISKRAMHLSKTRKVHACERSACNMPRRAERPASCSDPAHIRAREACSAQRPWRMMQNTSRCRRVIGRRHHLRSTPAPLRPLAAAPPCPKSPRAREVCGGSKLEAALKLLNGKSSGPRPQFVPVPFGLNLPLDFVP